MAKALIYMFVAIYFVLIYGIVSRFLAVRSVVWKFIGKHSLSIYLLHLLLIEILQRHRFDISNGVNICLLVCGTIAFSVLIDAFTGLLFKTNVKKGKSRLEKIKIRVIL